MASFKAFLGLFAVLFVASAIAAPAPVPAPVEAEAATDGDIEPAVYCGSGAKTGYCGSNRE